MTFTEPLAEDPAAALAGLAAILDHSSQLHYRSGATKKAQHLDTVASDTASLDSTLTSLHPQINLTPDQLVPQAATALPKGTLRNEYGPQTLFNVARGFSRRVPLVRLLEVEPDMRPYLASIVVRAV